MELKIQNLSKKLAFKLDKYQVQVGLLEDKKRKQPKFGEFKNYAGKTLLREGKVSTGASLVKVAEYLDERYKWLRKPFLIKNNKEVVMVLNDIVKDMNGQDLKQRILNGFHLATNINFFILPFRLGGCISAIFSSKHFSPLKECSLS